MSATSASADPASSYYGQPILKQPVWSWEIPAYFFCGGVAGASAGLALVAGASGNRVLARRAWPVAVAAIAPSPGLLISDLGRPARFYNMLRMVRPTSPMSVGSWILGGFGPALAVAALHSATGRLAGSARLARPLAALLGLPLTTYTGALVANTAIPVWHEARRELPFLFAASAAASAGAACCAATPVGHAGPARRLALAGTAAELLASHAMERRLGDLIGEPYHAAEAGRYRRLSQALSITGAGLLAARGSRSRAAAVAGGVLIGAGALAKRWSVFRAGFQSAADPRYTVAPQRARRPASTGAARTV